MYKVANDYILAKCHKYFKKFYELMSIQDDLVQKYIIRIFYNISSHLTDCHSAFKAAGIAYAKTVKDMPFNSIIQALSR